MSSSSSKISLSSDETQKELRIEKMHKLVAKGYNPFTPYSHRDFDLGFVKFWFNFVHKFDFDKIWEDGEKDLYNLDYFLQQVLFPRTLLERMEDKLQIRHTVREMGLDPDSDAKDFEDEYEDEIMDEARSLLPGMIGFDDDQKMISLRQYLKYTEEDEENEGELEITFSKNQKVTLAGRIKSKRTSGKIAFATVEDEQNAEGFQFVFRQDVVGVSDEDFGKIHPSMSEKSLTFADLKEIIDEGDYIQAYGKLDYSQRGEPSLFVEYFRILTKSLRPLPENLEDIEQKYRQRYLDMRINPEVREMFKQKSKFWQATRNFMVENGFLEVSMPTMEETTGGAEATPFVTHHDSLDQDFYLRISSELHQKRMIVGGFEKIFDIDKNYRNEGIDDEHLQEYTQMEFYWAYADYNNLIEFCERLIKSVIQDTFGTMHLNYQDKLVDWSKTWPRIPYYEFVEKYAGIKLQDYDTVEKLQKLTDKLGLKYDKNDGYGRMVDLIYKKTARPKCIEPVWLIDHPVTISPLSKRIPENPELTQRMQLIGYGSELTNGFSELNDPIDQLERFNEQQRLRDGGDDEAMMIDLDYVKALEIGMPPTAGFAYSERLFSVLSQKPIRETTPFPLMRKIENDGKPPKKRTKVAHILLLNKPEFPLWQKLNAASHLAASLGAREGEKLFTHKEQLTKESETIQMNIGHAIMLKQTDNKMDILELKRKAEKEGLTVTTFTKDMLSTTDDYKLEGIHSRQKAADIEWLGVLVFGSKKDVEALTDQFEMMG
jgi:lysyl-tRNA synthetase class 2